MRENVRNVQANVLFFSNNVHSTVASFRGGGTGGLQTPKDCEV